MVFKGERMTAEVKKLWVPEMISRERKLEVLRIAAASRNPDIVGVAKQIIEWLYPDEEKS